jgi:hypothetical protein
MAIGSVEADQVRLSSWQETAVPTTLWGVLGGVVLHVVTEAVSEGEETLPARSNASTI